MPALGFSCLLGGQRQGHALAPAELPPSSLGSLLQLRQLRRGSCCWQPARVPDSLLRWHRFRGHRCTASASWAVALGFTSHGLLMLLTRHPLRQTFYLFPSTLLSFFEARMRGVGQIKLWLVTGALKTSGPLR